MKSLHQTYYIKASPDEVFAALTNPALMEEWSASVVEMDPVPGGKFSLWGGDIYGTNIEISPEKIVQEWTAGDWDKPSIVTLSIHEAPDGCIVELDQTGIPDEEFKDISEGWEMYYLGQVQALFEEDEEEN